MNFLHVKVEGKTATYRRLDGAIVCGNDDYRVAFTFDEEWSAYPDKMARFIWGGKHYDVAVEGNEAAVPAIPEANEVYVGLYVEGRIRTTTSALIPCVPSVMSVNRPAHPEFGEGYTVEAKRAAEAAKVAQDCAEAAAGTAESAAATATQAKDVAAAAATNANADRAVCESKAAEAVSAAEQATSLAGNASRVPNLEKRLVNLEHGRSSEIFYRDNAVASSKAVPARVAPYAQISAVGGMSHKQGTEILDTKPTAILSTTVNLWPLFESENLGNIKMTVDERGVYTFTGTPNEESVSTSYKTVRLPAGTYQVWHFAENLHSGAPIAEVWLKGGTFLILRAPEHMTPEETRFTLTEDTDVMIILVASFGASIGGAVLYPMLVRSDTRPTEFIPPVLDRVDIPAEVQALDGYGWGFHGFNQDLYNGVEWDENGKATFVKRVGRVTFDGTETWGGGSTINGFYVSSVLPGAMVIEGQIITTLCNKFDFGTPDVIGVPCAYSTAGRIAVFPGTDATTHDEWKAKLAEWAAAGTPLTVYYQLAEPVVTDVSHLVTADNFIGVESGCAVRVENHRGTSDATAAVPSTLVYQLKPTEML